MGYIKSTDLEIFRQCRWYLWHNCDFPGLEDGVGLRKHVGAHSYTVLIPPSPMCIARTCCLICTSTHIAPSCAHAPSPMLRTPALFLDNTRPTWPVPRLQVIQTAKAFNVEAQIIGHVEASTEKKLTIRTEHGEFVY